MNKEEIKEYLADFQKNEVPDMINRGLKIAETNKIISIIGPRRAGKTYYLYQKIRELIHSDVKKEQIMYLNFEDPRLISVNFKEIREIIKLHRSIFSLYQQEKHPNERTKRGILSQKNKMYIFIDEPQNIQNWEISVRGLYEEGAKVFITGSSSKLLSKEIATSLRGRTLSYFLFPFSFKEYLSAKKSLVDITATTALSSAEKSMLMQLIDEYLEFGGFPEIVLENNKENKIKLISEYFNLVVYRDIIDRYNIRNTQLIKWIIKSLVSSFSKEFSINKIYLSLKSQGLKVSKNTLYFYLSLLEDSSFAFILPKFSYSIRKKEISVGKAYLCDNCFVKISETNENIGRKMENVVFLELLNKSNPLEELYYWKNVQQEEVDFVIKEKSIVKMLIQVCYNVNDITTKKRKIKALLKAGKELKCKELIIITLDYESEEEAEWFGMKGKITFIPLTKYLLLKR